MSKIIENWFLGSMKEEQIVVTIITTNGYQMKGIIAGYDADTILVDTFGRKRLVYKSSVSTIIDVDAR